MTKLNNNIIEPVEQYIKRVNDYIRNPEQAVFSENPCFDDVNSNCDIKNLDYSSYYNKDDHEINPSYNFNNTNSRLYSKGINNLYNQKRSKKRKLKSKGTVNLNLYCNNIRGLKSKKVSLEKILDDEHIDVAVISEVNTKKPPMFKDYLQFNRLSSKAMHGVSVFVHKSLNKHVIRIPDESELECVHIRLENTTPALNIIGVYTGVK